MSAIAQAYQLYEREGVDFRGLLGMYLAHGYVFCQPERLIIGVPIRLVEPQRIAAREEADAWFVLLAIGQGALRWFIDQMPYPLPHVAFHRNFKRAGGPLHVWPTDRLSAKLRK